MALKSKGNETMERENCLPSTMPSVISGVALVGRIAQTGLERAPGLLWLAFHNTDSLVDTRHVTIVFRRNQKGRSASAPQPRIPFPITSEERT